MASIVQKISATPGTGTTLAKAFASNVTAGNTIIVRVSTWKSGGGATITQVRDGVNGAVNYTLDKSDSANADGTLVAVYRFPNSAGGAMTVTATFGGTQDAAMEMMEISGLGTSQTVDVTKAGINGTVTSHTSGSVTTNTTDYLVGAYGDSGYNTTIAGGSGWTLEQASASSGVDQGAIEDQGLASGVAAGSYAATFTTGANSSSSCLLVAYQFPAGSGLPPGLGPNVAMDEPAMMPTSLFRY